MESESTMNEQSEESFENSYIPDWAFQEAEYNPSNEI